MEEPANKDIPFSLPDLSFLKEVLEDNASHNQQLVYDHTMAVFKELQLLLRLNFIYGKEHETRISAHLDGKAGNYSRRNLLLMAALLHDIGKGVSLKTNPDRTTSFPEHEKKGAGMVDSFAEQLRLGPPDVEFIKVLVSLHGEALDAVSSHTRNSKKPLDDIRKKSKDLFLELLLLSWADMLGSHLRLNNPEGFRKRNKAYSELINNLKL